MASVALALLQRRARAKQSRLRKKGATEEAIADVSPVRPWSEVKAMTAGQKLSYRAQLKRFTSRQNAYHVYSESGAISTKATHRNTQEAIEQINKARQAELDRINRIKVKAIPGAQNIYETVQARQMERVLEERDYRGRKTGRIHEYLGDVYGVGVASAGVEPRDKRTAERREQMFVEMAKRSYAERRKGLKDAVLDMARFAGADQLEAEIKSMTNIQFDVLTQRTNFMGELSAMYAPYAGSKDLKEARAAQAMSDEDAQNEVAYTIVRVVKQAVPRRQ